MCCGKRPKLNPNRTKSGLKIKKRLQSFSESPTTSNGEPTTNPNSIENINQEEKKSISNSSKPSPYDVQKS